MSTAEASDDQAGAKTRTVTISHFGICVKARYKLCMSSVHSARYQLFLKRLKTARLEAALTQERVAELLGRPQSFLSKCESGERRVDVVELEEFARIYRKSLNYFLPP